MSGVLLRVGVIGAILLGGFIFRDHLTGAATDLKIGDCFDEPGTVEVTEVQHRPCTDPHDGEIMWVGDYPDPGSYPGEEAFDAFVGANCVPTYQTYLGRDYRTDTEFDIGLFYPLPEGWEDGDHEITCYIYRLDKAKLTNSVKIAS